MPCILCLIVLSSKGTATMLAGSLVATGRGSFVVIHIDPIFGSMLTDWEEICSGYFSLFFTNMKWAFAGKDYRRQKRWLWCPLVAQSQYHHLPRNSTAGWGQVCVCRTHYDMCSSAPQQVLVYTDFSLIRLNFQVFGYGIRHFFLLSLQRTLNARAISNQKYVRQCREYLGSA